MSHRYCDVLGMVAIAGLAVGLTMVSPDNQNFVLYAGLAALGAYAYVSIEVIPRRRRKAQALAVAIREVLPPPIPVETIRNGHPVPEHPRRPLHRIAA